MSGVGRIFNRHAGVRAGLAGIVVDNLRRMAARNMVRAGVPERVATMQLGHRTRSMFDRSSVVGHVGLTCEQ